jgi:AAA family ATP:ADP antiporter
MESTPEMKRNILYILGTYFLILFSYPFVRVATTTMFLDTYGAAATPKAQVVGIVFVSLFIMVINHFQKRYGIHKIYSIFSAATAATFLVLYLVLKLGWQPAAFILYSFKEAYIVLVVHLIVGYCNHYFTSEQVKLFYGPLGGLGSLGALLGGIITSFIAKNLGITTVMFSSSLFLGVTSFLFWKTIRVEYKEEEKKQVSPLRAVAGVKEYAFLIAAIIALSQFAITVAELKFNLLFEQLVASSQGRAEKLALVYSSINAVALFMQFIVLPLLAIRVSTKVLHYFVPLFYILVFFLGNGIGGELLLPVVASFVLFKGTDYSLFAVIKEVLYQSMGTMQKYGAKYIADMFSYRTAKGFISLVLIPYQTTELLNVLIYSFLFVWIIALYFLFHYRKKYFQES